MHASNNEQTQRLEADPIPTWAVWRYEADEWNRFDEREWAKAQQSRFVVPLICFVIGLALSIIATNASRSYGFLETGCLFLLITGFLVMVGGFFSVLSYEPEKSRHQARQRGPREVRITPIGLYEADKYVPLLTRSGPALWSETYLRQVYSDLREPTLLRFRVASWDWGRYREHEVRIAVPQGRSAEAEELIAQFQREVIYGDAWRQWVNAANYQSLRTPSAAAPTQPLLRPWVGGTPDSSRYGRQTKSPEDSPVAEQDEEHNTKKLPPQEPL